MKKSLLSLCLLFGLCIFNLNAIAAQCAANETPCSGGGCCTQYTTCCGKVGGHIQCCGPSEVCCPKNSNVCCGVDTQGRSQCSVTKCCYQDANHNPLIACKEGDYCCYEGGYCCPGNRCCANKDCTDCVPPPEPAALESFRERRRITSIRPERGFPETPQRRER